ISKDYIVIHRKSLSTRIAAQCPLSVWQRCLIFSHFHRIQPLLCSSLFFPLSVCGCFLSPSTSGIRQCINRSRWPRSLFHQLFSGGRVCLRIRSRWDAWGSLLTLSTRYLSGFAFPF